MNIVHRQFTKLLQAREAPPEAAVMIPLLMLYGSFRVQAGGFDLSSHWACEIDSRIWNDEHG